MRGGVPLAGAPPRAKAQERLLERDVELGLDELAVLDRVDGEAHAGRVAVGVEGQAADGRVDGIVVEHLDDLGGVGGAGLLDVVDQGEHGGEGVVAAKSGLGAELLPVRFAGFLEEGQGARVLGIGAVDVLGRRAELEDGLVLHAVGADDGAVHLLAAELLDELAGQILVAAEDDDVGLQSIDAVNGPLQQPLSVGSIRSHMGIAELYYAVSVE